MKIIAASLLVLLLAGSALAEPPASQPAATPVLFASRTYTTTFPADDAKRDVGPGKVFAVAVVGEKVFPILLGTNALGMRTILAVVKIGNADVRYKVQEVTAKAGVLTVRYATTSKKQDSMGFTCYMAVLVPKGDYSVGQFDENGEIIKKLTFPQPTTQPHDGAIKICGELKDSSIGEAEGTFTLATDATTQPDAATIRLAAKGSLVIDKLTATNVQVEMSVTTKEMDGLLAKVREKLGVPASQPADAESAWKAVLTALQAGDKKALAKVTTAEGCKSLMQGGWNGPDKEMTPENMRSLGQGWAKWQVRFYEKTADTVAAHLGPEAKEHGLSFVRTDDGWKLNRWMPGD